MKSLQHCVLLLCYVIYFVTVTAEEVDINEKLQAIAKQIEVLRTIQMTDSTRLNSEVEELKQTLRIRRISNHERNEQAAFQWVRSSIYELKVRIKELSDNINSSYLLKQLSIVRNELNRALSEASDLTLQARAQEVRVDKVYSVVSRLKYEEQQMRSTTAELRNRLVKVEEEVKTNQMKEFHDDSFNEILKLRDDKSQQFQSARGHKYRHDKMVHAQISRLAHSQNQLDTYQQKLQTQILDVQRRLDRYEEPNWNLLSAKVDILKLETKNLRDEVQNSSHNVSDLDKVHASMLELREDVESVENKVDKTIPEFRKEISKLDVNLAQLHAQTSYLKEDQENLRKSVKAIAVSVSNAIDRAEMDRITMEKINGSVAQLDTRSKQHFYRLNDHILKSESKINSTNGTEIDLTELIEEVIQLQPVEREYEDLVNQLPRDCSSVSGPAGTYLINPAHAPISSWCADGYTLLQSRYNGSVEFNRKFKEYVHDFGEPTSEYWIGLEAMHKLTVDNCSSMRIDMTDIYGGSWYATYEHFYVGNADSGYVLEVDGFEGNASDAFEYQNRMEFSTIDRDRDISNTHCAGNYEGGWWFSHCQHVNINGKYNLGLTWFDSARNEWIAVATTNMFMYRRSNCF